MLLSGLFKKSVECYLCHRKWAVAEGQTRTPMSFLDESSASWNAWRSVQK